jgi:hypothetical protein
LKYFRDDDKTFTRHWYYRLLHEDPGCPAYTDVALKGFLEQEFDRLYLAREIREIHDQGEMKPGASIFSTEIRREGSTAILHPLWPGADLDENVKRHLRFLKDEAISNIFFSLDLGVSWHSSLMRVLTDNHYRPALIIPFAGQADILMFQYDRTEP